tara:strand:+ start:7719 stop:9419 length:1701 start_codon:yes stop_codon:yes gene_type:complete
MEDDLDTGLWSSGDVSAEFESFADEFGETIRELKAPTPQRSLRNHGPSEYNSRQLDRHTGGHFWAAKGDDVESETVFEANLIRPVDKFVSDHRRRSAVQLNLNRNDTQRETLREDFAPRDSSLYSGKNPIVQKEMRHFVSTRRSEQEVGVVGAERRLESRAAMSSDHEDPLKVGLYRKEDDETRGRVSRLEERAGRTTRLHMGEWSGLHSLTPNDRMTSHSGRDMVRGDAPLSQYDSALSHVANRVTSQDRPWGQTKERSDVTLSMYDSQPGTDSRATRHQRHHRSLDAEDTVLGSHDSAASRNPQRSTFSDIARVAADLVIGVQDSRPKSGTALIGTHTVPLKAMASDVVPTKRVGPAFGREGWHDYAGEHRRVLEGERGRDSASDSQYVERVVADQMERRNSVAAEHARRLRDDAVVGRVGLGRSRRDAPSIPHEDVQIGGSDATRLEQERRERIERHARPTDAVHSRAWNSSSTIPIVPVARDSVDVALPPVMSQPQRRWRDGGAVSSRQQPLSTGPTRPPVTSGTSEAVPRRASIGTVGRAVHPHMRSDTPAMYLSSESIRV